ncbi:MAG: hypothetical protein PHS14_20250, partial [Elusimicrobia bacterium]|nr:hypothetical protein [Elusimicrobiota bacterium]
AFNGKVGGLHSLLVDPDGGVIRLNGGTLDTGAQSYYGNVVLGDDTTLISNGGDVALNGKVDGLHSLLVDPGAGVIRLNGGTVKTGAQSYYGNVVLGDDMTLLSGGGDILFAGGVSGGAGAHALFLDATAGDGSAAVGDVAWNASLAVRSLRIFGKDILMGGDVATSGADGVLMVAGNSFKNAASHGITPAGGGRFLIYSVGPERNILGGLAGSAQYGTTFEDGPLPGFAGSGFLYRDEFSAPPSVDINFAAVNDNPFPFDLGFIGGGDEPEDGGGLAGADGDNGSASASDLFPWDLGTMRDAVASLDDPDSSGDSKRKKKKKHK